MPYEIHKLLKEALEAFIKKKGIYLKILKKGYSADFVHYLLTETKLTELVKNIKVVEWGNYHSFLVIKPKIKGAIYQIVDSDTIAHCYKEYTKESEYYHYEHFINTYMKDTELLDYSKLDKKEVGYKKWLNNIERRKHG